MLLGTLAASLLSSMLTGKWVIQDGEGAPATSWGQGTIRGERIIRVGQDF